MKRLLAALAFLLLPLSQSPAAAQSPAEVAALQNMLADVGQWSLEHSAIMERASAPLAGVEAYIHILDSFENGDIDVETAAERIRQWRDSALGAIGQAKRDADNLRQPPSLALLGAEGVGLSVAMRTTRENTTPTLVEFERVVTTITEYGLAALRDRHGALEAQQRAVLSASAQLVRVDLARIRVNAASLADDHPNQALMNATAHYYAVLMGVPQLAINELNGQGDRVAMIAALRRSAQSMRDELARCDALTRQMRARFGAVQAGPGVEMVRSVIEMVETFPDSIRAYQGLVNNVDQVIEDLERGTDAVQVWVDQSDRDAPYMEEIARLEQVRATLVANNNRRPL
jgi:hypothetical protein